MSRAAARIIDFSRVVEDEEEGEGKRLLEGERERDRIECIVV